MTLRRRKIGPGTGKPCKVTFVGAGGQSVTVDCPEDQYILDAGIDAGLELPFTCRGGICGACIAKCTSGPSVRPHQGCYARSSHRLPPNPPLPCYA